MEVRALCFTDLMFLNFLLIPHVQSKKDDSDFLITTARLQYFEYESVTFHCVGLHGSTQLKWIRNHRNIVSPCDTSMKSCTIVGAYETDSGQYWCETERRNSSTVNITVTAGPVILDSPDLLILGEVVNLRCKNKRDANLKAVFYKDDIPVSISPAGEMRIDNVSQSHEGLYRCNVSGVGTSAGSWLTVRDQYQPEDSANDLSLLWAVVTILMLVLVLLGFVHIRKRRAASSSGEHNQTVSGEDNAEDPHSVPYAVVVTQQRKDKEATGAGDNLCLCLKTNQSRKPQREEDEDESSHQLVYAAVTIRNSQPDLVCY
ncbi:uncharacterized protein [Channa argus]|uniref:uncharacterized protein isoform X2 n=1 Tax=Channa argus TaxID=215402 RepID=UPI00352043DB